MFGIKPFKPRQIAVLRKREQVIRTVVGFYLNVSRSLISKWERGDRKPSGASLKLLTLIEKKGLDWVA